MFKLAFITVLLCKCLSDSVLANNSKTRTLLISFNGLKADSLDSFLSKNPNSYLKRDFVDVGVKANYMTPSFPAMAFPNHFSYVTGK
jgi:predicted AlkP superfamily pyrophosphatase or phosphodiesterase